MKSHYDGYTKHFLTLSLKSEGCVLEGLVSTTLNGKSPKYPLHLTLGTIHVNSEKTKKLVSVILKGWRPDSLGGGGGDGTLITCISPRYKLMGQSNIKFVSLLFGIEPTTHINIGEIRIELCKWLTTCIYGGKGELLMDGDKSVYKIIGDNDVDIRIPMVMGLEIPLYHTSLFSTNDMKHCNKTLYEEYKGCSNPNTFIEKMVLPESLVLKMGDVVFT
jgi:hypothetical protein